MSRTLAWEQFGITVNHDNDLELLCGQEVGRHFVQSSPSLVSVKSYKQDLPSWDLALHPSPTTFFSFVLVSPPPSPALLSKIPSISRVLTFPPFKPLRWSLPLGKGRRLPGDCVFTECENYKDSQGQGLFKVTTS